MKRKRTLKGRRHQVSNHVKGQFPKKSSNWTNRQWLCRTVGHQKPFFLQTHLRKLCNYSWLYQVQLLHFKNTINIWITLVGQSITIGEKLCVLHKLWLFFTYLLTQDDDFTSTLPMFMKTPSCSSCLFMTAMHFLEMKRGK